MAGQAYRPRLADRVLARLTGEFPAVLVNGPRAVGKTTTAQQLADDVVHLDQPAQAAAFRADPDAALRVHAEPLLLDEWQEVPEVLGAVKRAVDTDPRPGRFILTGSVRAQLEGRMWPGTGRLIRLSMYGLSERELHGNLDGPGVLEKIALGDPAAFATPPRPPDIIDYLELALRSGFPEPALRHRSEEARATWLDSYVAQLVSRDAAHIEPRRDPERLRRFLEAVSLSTAGLPTDKTLFDASGVNAKTAAVYDDLFDSLYITERLTAWSSNRLSRLTKAPKRYVVDPAIAASAAGLTVRTIIDDGDLLGRYFDTFAVAQIRPEVAASRERVRLHHLRTNGGRHEVDLVAELPGRRVVAIEIKASAAVGLGDARHLRWLRDELGPAFVGGAVVHAGPAAYELDDRILAVPLCSLWS